MKKYGHEWRNVQKIRRDLGQWRSWPTCGGYFAEEGFYLLIPAVEEGLGFDEHELTPKEEE